MYTCTMSPRRMSNSIMVVALVFASSSAVFTYGDCVGRAAVMGRISASGINRNGIGRRRGSHQYW